MNSEAANQTSLYRAVWRWHFYAGLLVLPFLLWLAVTGALYLYKSEIERLVYHEWTEVSATSANPLPLEHLIAETRRQTGGTVTQVSKPAHAEASWRLAVDLPSGEQRTAFVDPYSGRLLGETAKGGVMQMVRDLHSLIITGPVGNAVIEIVAGWTIILVLTGFYLWWPWHGQRAIALRGRPRTRLFWRDLHATTGAVAGLVILFLAVTGMPWSGFWGKQLQIAVAANGLGRPKSPGPNPWETKGHSHGDAAKATLPWSLQEAQHPPGHGRGDIGPDRAAAIAAARGLQTAWTMTLPSSPQTPYLVSATVTRADDARALYIEPASGRILQDARYKDFGAGARAIEWGIATHQGQQYGEANRLLMLAGCLAIVLLVISAPVLWWKRRTRGPLAAPPRPLDRHKARGVAALMLVAGAIFPLTGATMILAMLVDRIAGAAAAGRRG